jgi:hypothetical protein
LTNAAAFCLPTGQEEVELLLAEVGPEPVEHRLGQVRREAVRGRHEHAGDTELRACGEGRVLGQPVLAIVDGDVGVHVRLAVEGVDGVLPVLIEAEGHLVLVGDVDVVQGLGGLQLVTHLVEGEQLLLHRIELDGCTRH